MFETFKSKQLLLTGVALDVLEAIDTGRSLGCAICLRYDSLESLPTTFSPTDYSYHVDYLKDAQALALISKNGHLNPLPDLETKARATFDSCEKSCAEANVRLRDKKSIPFDILSLLSSARDWIFHLLGPSPQQLDSFRFGPGATLELSARDASLSTKCERVPTVTAGALPLLRGCFSNTLYSPNIMTRNPVIVQGNRFTTVPKNFRNLRPICIEPGGNLVCQLSLATQMRRKLCKAGYDLNFLQFHHRQLARLASIDGRFATIDLSGASDTICCELVKLLLPLDWWTYLNRLRSPNTELAGVLHKNEKFSSMGNGFTFELETIIFLALCKAVCSSHGSKTRSSYSWADPELSRLTSKPLNQTYSINLNDCSVFGDDILIHQDLYPVLERLLKFCGFSVNPSKSFSDGPFRESCGADFWLGHDVRPIFLKTFPNKRKGLILLHNAICEMEEKLGFPLCRAKARVLGQDSSKLFGPFGLDGCYWTSRRKDWRTRMHRGRDRKSVV